MPSSLPLQVQRQLLLPSLFMSVALSSTKMISPLLITPIPVGHLFGLLNISGWSV